MSEKLILITTLNELDNLTDYLKDKEYVAFDTETTGLDKTSEIIGFSVCADTEVAYYVVLSRWKTDKLEYFETKEKAKEFLSFLTTRKLIMHNAIFDCAVVEANFGVSLIKSVHTDTMLLAHLLDENRMVGLKELGAAIFGEDAKNEQKEMQESIKANGGSLTRAKYELFKADYNLIGKYGAKDTILTLKLFYHFIPELYEQDLDKFFYEEETMPLLRGATYDLNTVGLRIDMVELQKLKASLEAECLEAKGYIEHEIRNYVKDKYPGTSKSTIFNIGATKQLSWLLFDKLNNMFHLLTKEGKELCKALDFPIPYSNAQKRAFIDLVISQKGHIYCDAKYNPKTKKMGRPKKVGDYWNYLACGKETLQLFEDKYKWVKCYLEYAKSQKLLNTYVEGIQERAKYSIIYPSFLQHGTTSGRYSSRNPNFQNLPRKDKRIKKCIISRPGKVFVGADQSQLEPRVFASYSKDVRLMKCFADGDDFYSVIGVEVFDKQGLSLKKDDENSFAKKHPDLRDISKIVGLSATYGTTAFKMGPAIKKSPDEAQMVIDSYFDKFPSVYAFMIGCHEQVKTEGRVCNLFGRPRRLPEALNIKKLYGNASHGDLPYTVRNMLNLAVNHTIQSTGASIMNRAAIAIKNECESRALTDPSWNDVKIVLQVHDELVLEGPQELAQEMSSLLKDKMENTVKLPGVSLVADPVIGKSLAELKKD